ncbi:MAG: universal stress protein [Thiohalomonadaceae bacterium]
MPYQHILLATDFSAAARKAASRSVELARLYQARLTLVHVVEHFPENLPVTMGAREDRDPKTYLMTLARDRLADLATELGVPEAAQVVRVSHRSARYEIQIFSEENAVDLIVLGSLPHGLLGSLGSTASGLLSTARCDLMVVRGTERSSARASAAAGQGEK